MDMFGVSFKERFHGRPDFGFFLNSKLIYAFRLRADVTSIKEMRKVVKEMYINRNTLSEQYTFHKDDIIKVFIEYKQTGYNKENDEHIGHFIVSDNFDGFAFSFDNTIENVARTIDRMLIAYMMDHPTEFGEALNNIV